MLGISAAIGMLIALDTSSIAGNSEQLLGRVYVSANGGKATFLSGVEGKLEEFIACHYPAEIKGGTFVWESYAKTESDSQKLDLPNGLEIISLICRPSTRALQGYELQLLGVRGGKKHLFRLFYFRSGLRNQFIFTYPALVPRASAVVMNQQRTKGRIVGAREVRFDFDANNITFTEMQ